MTWHFCIDHVQIAQKKRVKVSMHTSIIFFSADENKLRYSIRGNEKIYERELEDLI